tara:strand:+ start:5324 stop:8452 length:3129 start_codon:yes stop_codon:yes gene_type:complete
MADPVLQRPMFGGQMPPMQDNSVGTGITSGLVDPEQQQAFGQIAGGMEDMLSNIDAASSVEEIMDSVRGDQGSMEDRRGELAGYVGEKDAKTTPESVLALLQPTFTIMDMMKEQSAAGGIANAMPMGDPNAMMPMEAPVAEGGIAGMMGAPPTNFNQGGTALQLANGGLVESLDPFKQAIMQGVQERVDPFVGEIVSNAQEEFNLTGNNLSEGMLMPYQDPRGPNPNIVRPMPLSDMTSTYTNTGTDEPAFGAQPSLFSNNSSMVPFDRGYAPDMLQQGQAQQNGFQSFAGGGYVQSPGMEEASMRMMQGEQPVYRAEGTNPYTVNYPELTKPNFSNIQSNIQDFTSLIPTLNLSQGETDANVIAQQRLNMLGDYLPEAKTKEEYLNDYKNFMGTKDTQGYLDEYNELFAGDAKKDFQRDAFIRLAQLGSQIAGSDRNLLGAVTENLGGFAAGLGEDAKTLSAEERAAKQYAFQQSKSDEQASLAYAFQKEQDAKATLNSQQSQIVLSAINSAEKNNNSLNETTNTAILSMAQQGINTEITNVKTINDQAHQHFVYSNKSLTTPFIEYGKLIDGKIDVIRGRIDPKDGNMMYYNQDKGAYELVPDDYTELNSAGMKALDYNTSKVDYSSVKAKTFLVPDAKAELGYRQVDGGFDPQLGYLIKDENNQWVSAPNGYNLGKLSEITTTSEQDGGRVYVTVTGPDGNSRRNLVSFDGKSLPTSYMYQTPEYALDEKTGTRSIASGNIMVNEVDSTTFQNYANISAAQKQWLGQRGDAHISTLSEIDKILLKLSQTDGKPVGPLSNFKLFANNTLSAWVPGDGLDSILQWSKTQEGRSLTNVLTRELRKSLALSSRYAVTEQEINSRFGLTEADFWKDPKAALVKLQVLGNYLQNDLNAIRSQVDPEGTPLLRADLMPQGNWNDPLIMNDGTAPEDSELRQLYYVNNLIKNNAPMENVVIQFNNGYELQSMLENNMLDLAVPESAYKTGDQYLMEPIKITINNGMYKLENDTSLKSSNEAKNIVEQGFNFIINYVDPDNKVERGDQ